MALSPLCAPPLGVAILPPSNTPFTYPPPPPVSHTELSTCSASLSPWPFPLPLPRPQPRCSPCHAFIPVPVPVPAPIAAPFPVPVASPIVEARPAVHARAPCPRASQRWQHHRAALAPCLIEEVAESDGPCEASPVHARTTAATSASVDYRLHDVDYSVHDVDYRQRVAADYTQHAQLPTGATIVAQDGMENLESRVESRPQPLDSFLGGGSVLRGVDCGPVDRLFPAQFSPASAADGSSLGTSAVAVGGGGGGGGCGLPVAASCGATAGHAQAVTSLAVLERIRALPGLGGGAPVPHRPMSRGAKAAVARVMLRRRAAEQHQKQQRQQRRQKSEGELAAKARDMPCPRAPLVAVRGSPQAGGEAPLAGWEEARGVGKGEGMGGEEAVEEGREGRSTVLSGGGSAAAAAARSEGAALGPVVSVVGTKRAARELRAVAEAAVPVSKAARTMWEVVACSERALADAAGAIRAAHATEAAAAAAAEVAAAEVAGSVLLGWNGLDEGLGRGFEWLVGEELGVRATSQRRFGGGQSAGAFFEVPQKQFEWPVGEEVGVRATSLSLLGGGQSGGAGGLCVGQCACCGGVKAAWTECIDSKAATCVGGLSDDVISRA
ncbi:hypothetical protein CLOM_g12973 [Closterium sp. NIES-68]|nr:hypothetical protein CLOM_g12973 [Closterium sp. NIES-68]GJP80062.1 hypothetical protein CLOP_g10297 [Closterium sp. NIES-67]